MVLIGCEKSGVVRDAFIKAGFAAVSCDLLPTESPGPHIVGDIVDVLKSRRWAFVGLHPNCRELCLSGNHKYAAGKPGHAARLRAAAWTRDLWELAKQQSSRVYLENSANVLASLTDMPKRTQAVQPYDFGHDASKQTWLWLHGLPKLEPTKMVAPRLVCCGETLPDGVGKYGCPYCQGDKKPKMRWANQTDSGQNRLPPSATRSADRAKTYQGIADAMVTQWRGTVSQKESKPLGDNDDDG